MEGPGWPDCLQNGCKPWMRGPALHWRCECELARGQIPGMQPAMLKMAWHHLHRRRHRRPADRQASSRGHRQHQPAQCMRKHMYAKPSIFLCPKMWGAWWAESGGLLESIAFLSM